MKKYLNLSLWVGAIALHATNPVDDFPVIRKVEGLEVRKMVDDDAICYVSLHFYYNPAISCIPREKGAKKHESNN